jgi:hypothetical protein
VRTGRKRERERGREGGREAGREETCQRFLSRTRKNKSMDGRQLSFVLKSSLSHESVTLTTHTPGGTEGIKLSRYKSLASRKSLYNFNLLL